MIRSQLNILRLVYPPLTNQEAEWLKEYPEVKQAISKSNLYMITQRVELHFGEFTLDLTEDGVYQRINYQLSSPEQSMPGSIDLSALLDLRRVDLDLHDIAVELGDKLIRIWEVDSNGTRKAEPIDWFTADKMLFDKSRGHPAVFGLDDYMNFMDYTVHYVGISSKEDSLTRLVRKAHDKRSRVLSNENPRRHGARTTDEIILLFFTAQPLKINQYDTNDDSFDLEDDGCNTRVIADAEKALIHILKPEYNTIRYDNFPKGKDGLYNSDLSRYGYVLGENMSLGTSNEVIRGGYITEQAWQSTMDMIFVEGDKVELLKADDLNCNAL